MALPNGLAFVAAQIVHHHQLVRPERGNEHFLDVGAEAFAVDRTVDEPRRLDAVVAKRGDEGHGFPMAVGNFGDEPLAAPRPASQRLHVGLRPRLVDEHQTLGVDPALTLCPLGAPPQDVRPIALAGDDGFFEVELLGVHEREHADVSLQLALLDSLRLDRPATRVAASALREWSPTRTAFDARHAHNSCSFR
jgi:hypothetical protein